MQVAIFNAPGDITIEDLPDPDLGTGQVRLEVARCGICGSDVTMTSGSAFDYECGRAIGHEYSGEVIEIARGVTTLKLGDRVACIPKGNCGTCDVCRAGRPLFCPNGPPVFGGFGQRIVVPEGNVAFRLPASVSLAEGALVEPMACGRKALRVARMEKGARVLVLGAGNMALSVIYWARLMGAGRIVVATRSAKRDAIAMSFGADAAVRLNEDDPGAITRALGGEPDIVAECIGKPGMIGLAIQHARLGGTVLSLGMCTVADPLLPAFAVFKEVSLHFPLAYALDDVEQTIRAFDSGTVAVGEMVSKTISLAELPAMIHEMRGEHDHLKVQVAPNGGAGSG
jgi:threonine dehydrogenase-like Zn-dependent dehydrogenase